MRRGTTPTFTINVTGATFTGCKVFVTIRQDGYVITKTGDDIDISVVDESNCKIVVGLTQEETLAFKAAKAAIQLRWIDSAGTAGASSIKEFCVNPILLDGEITYADD